MISMVKVAIIVTVAIVAAAVGFAMTGGSGIPSDIPVTVVPVIEQAKDIKKDIEPAIEKIKELTAEGKKILEETKMATE